MNFYYAIKDRIQGKAPKGAKRSKLWRAVRKTHINQNPECAICSKNKNLEVHHLIPFHLAPDLELNPENLVTLCDRCHLFVGHLGDYKSVNVSCKIDVSVWSQKFKGR